METIEDLKVRIEIKDGVINELKDIINGIIKENGYKWGYEDKWYINTSSILSSLIKTAARCCDSYASDLFIIWKHRICKPLDDGTMESSTVVFAFRDMGVDSNESYEYYRGEYHYYREVWFVDFVVDGNKITMTLHK